MLQNVRFAGFIYGFLWLLFLILFEFITGEIRGISLQYDIIVCFCKCFLLVIIVNKKWKQEFVPFFVAFNFFYGLFLLGSVITYLLNNRVVMVAWPNIIMSLLGAWTAYAYLRSKLFITKTTYLSIGLALMSLSFFQYKYIRYFNSFNTFSLIRNIWVDSNTYSITDATNNKVKLEKDITYIIDFWHTRCGVCFTKFPDFNNRALNNKNTDIRYVSINFPLNSDSTHQAFEVMKQYKYSFPIYKGSNNINKTFNIQVYPTIVVFRNDTILYKGNLDRLNDYLNKYY